MKKRLLSILAAVVLVLALSVPLAVPVFAAAPVLTSVTPNQLAGVPSFITTNGVGTTYFGVTFTGTFTNPPTAVTISGAGLTVNPLSFGSITTTSFTADVVVAAGAAHGPRYVTVTTADGVSNILYSAILVGEFPSPALGGTGAEVGISIVPYYDAGGLFTVSTPSATPITTAVVPGTVIWYRASVYHEDPTKFDFLGGQLSIRFPANPPTNAYIPVAGYGAITSAHPEFPEVTPGSPFTAFAPVPYIASTADLDATGYLIAEADYGSTGDNPTEINGVVQGIAPTTLNASITNSLLMAGSLRVTKSVVIPPGVLLNGINKTFTVTVTGPGGYNNPLTFTVTNGVLQNPTFYDLDNLTPGTYHVAESPGSPWVESAPTSGNVEVTSDGDNSTTVTNTYVPGSLTVSKVVNLNGMSGTGITQNFSVTVSGPSSFSQVLTFHMVNGIVSDSPQTINNLVPGAYTVVETNPGSTWSYSVSNSGNVTVSSNATATSTVTNNLAIPHTTLQSIVANPPVIPVGGGLVTVTVTDINDGDLPITGPYFTLTGVPAFPGSPATMTKVSDDGNHDAVMDPGETWIFSYTVNITTETSFTAVGHGMAGGSDITGPSETRTMVVSPPPVPASTNLGIALMILVFGGAIAIFGLQRRRRSQNS